jgi:hypothetical protein
MTLDFMAASKLIEIDCEMTKSICGKFLLEQTHLETLLQISDTFFGSQNDVEMIGRVESARSTFKIDLRKRDQPIRVQS